LHSRAKRIKFENGSLNITNSIETKRKLWNTAAKALGYDLTRGQIAVTVHPFMQAFDKNDVRVAVNDNVDSISSFYGAMHEMGHAIYEQNIADELNNTGMGSPFSSALHESQSLFCEQYLGKSELFWNENYENVFELPVNSTSVRNVVTQLRAFDQNNVVRLRASELDYGLHIILRFELEKALFSGQLEPKQMREFFNELTMQYFGRYPENDKEGVLQDTHWYNGLFGYFPSYLFGAIFAAQLWDLLKNKQNTQEVLLWLKDNIHVHGGTRDYKSTLNDVTGDEMPNVSLYTNWLEKEFSLVEV
jgi:carboxypeptidase Taq